MICEKNKCTGCFACYNICPKNAITMKEDEFGYIYPNIDKEKCINCNLCKKVCPSLQHKDGNKSQICLAMWNKNEDIRAKSTSGGIATTVYSAILQRGGVIYGCTNSLDERIPFIRIEKIEDLYKIKGSKYVHAYVNDQFRNVKQDLESQKEVMFIGTPCQVAGLKSFLGKEYPNLYVADIICHGVPSQKLLKEEITTKVNEMKNIKVTFRENGKYRMKVYSNDIEILNEGQDKNFYVLAFMKSLFHRENCYECKYANPKRLGDITLGDFWGIGKQDNVNKYKDEEIKGISVCLVNTEKGKKLIDMIKEDCYAEERNVYEAINGNSQLRHPSIKNKEYEKFRTVYLKYGYKKASKKCLRLDKNKKKLKKILKKVRGK